MRLLLTDQALMAYLRQKFSLKKNLITSLMATAIERDGNKVLLSKHSFNLTEQFAKQDPSLSIMWELFVKELIDKGNYTNKVEIVLTNSDPATGSIKELHNIYSKTDKNYVLTISLHK